MRLRVEFPPLSLRKSSSPVNVLRRFDPMAVATGVAAGVAAAVAAAVARVRGAGVTAEIAAAGTGDLFFRFLGGGQISCSRIAENLSRLNWSSASSLLENAKPMSALKQR